MRLITSDFFIFTVDSIPLHMVFVGDSRGVWLLPGVAMFFGLRYFLGDFGGLFSSSSSSDRFLMLMDLTLCFVVISSFILSSVFF